MLRLDIGNGHTSRPRRGLVPTSTSMPCPDDDGDVPAQRLEYLRLLVVCLYRGLSICDWSRCLPASGLDAGEAPCDLPASRLGIGDPVDRLARVGAWCPREAVALRLRGGQNLRLPRLASRLGFGANYM